HARAVARERGLLASLDAAPPQHAERADGVPDHRDARLGAGACRDGGVAQLCGLRRLPSHRRRRASAYTGAVLAAPACRSAVPPRAPAQLQPQVLAALAPALLLLRALGRPAARRARVSARRVAAHAAGPVGPLAGPRGAVRYLLPLVALAFVGAGQSATGGMDWNRFGYDTARHNQAPGSGITAANVSKLERLTVHLDGTVDSSPIYLHDVRVHGKSHDVFFVTTTYGRTEAIDADTGSVLWRFTPPIYSRVAGTAQITNPTPAA